MVAKEVFPGGCFFSSANAEFDTRPGTVRDRLESLQTVWLGELIDQYAAAQAAGRLADPGEAEQGAFELHAYLHLANDLYVMYRDQTYVDRARRSISAQLARYRPNPGDGAQLGLRAAPGTN
jgi:hypothetical protein